MNVIIANKYKELLMNLDIDVIKSEEGVFEVDDLINRYSNFFFNRMILDITAIKDYTNLDTIQKLSINLDMNKLILFLDESEESNSPSYLSKLISMGIYNFTKNLDGVKYLYDNPNSYRDVAHLHNVTGTNSYVEGDAVHNKIIGVKSLTSGAGATTLIYMMKKELEGFYSVCAIEVDKRDLQYFDDKDMYSTNSNDLPKELMKHKDYNIVLVDLNGYSDPDICSEVLYLVEPSKLKLNKLLKQNKNALSSLSNKKIILNRSNVTDSEIKDFEFETNSKVFDIIPNVNERGDSDPQIIELLNKLGLARMVEDKEESSLENKAERLLGMFKF